MCRHQVAVDEVMQGRTRVAEASTRRRSVMWARRVQIVGLLGLLTFADRLHSQPLAPTFRGWERYFSVSCEPIERKGQPYLAGYIVSSYGVLATRVQLLVDSLDASGKIVAQRVEWLGGSNLPGFSTTYFE